MRLFNILLIIFGVTISQVYCDPIGNEMHERYERGLIDISREKIMNLIKHGDSDSDVPVFDPYNIEKYDIGVFGKDLLIVGKLTATSIQGLSVMKDLHTEHDFWKRKIKLTLVFPWIYNTGNYNIDRITIGNDSQRAYGNFTAIITDIAVTVNLAYEIAKSRVSLQELKIDNVRNIQVFAVGNHNNNNTGLIIDRNESSDETALNFCERFHITNFITDTFGESLNAIFKGKSIPQIRNMLG